MDADLRGLVAELRELASREDSAGWRQAVMDKAARIELSVAQGQGFVLDKETIKFAMTAARLLQGFMLDTNVVGAREAGVNLAHGIRDYLDAALAQPDGVSK